jgi:dsRNA-specific ribonuclease
MGTTRSYQRYHHVNTCISPQHGNPLTPAYRHVGCLITVTIHIRLEFLGDAVLDFLIMRHVYNRLLATDASRMTPALLSDMRRQMTNNEAFARITVEHGFHNFLAQASSSLFHSINQYVVGAQRDVSPPRWKKAKSGALVRNTC